MRFIHKKSWCLYLLLCMFFGSIIKVQAQWHYNFEAKTFGGGTTAFCATNKMIETLSGTLLIAGSIYSDSTYPLNFRGNYDVWMLKLDANMNKIGESVLGSSAAEGASALITCSDGGYLIAFTSQGNDSDITCYYSKADGTIRISTHLFKFDNNDTLLWERCYGDTINNSLLYGDGIRESSKNEILLSMGGSTGCASNYFTRIKLLDNLGNIKWQICGSQLNGLGFSRCTAEDVFGNYYMGTEAGSPYYYFPNVASQINDVGIVKMDTNGVISQASVYGGNGIDKIHKLLPQANGDLILVLSSTSTAKHSGELLPNYGSNLIWLIRVDGNGTVLQESFLGGNASVVIQDAIQLKNGNIMLANYSKCSYFMNQDSTGYHPSPLSLPTDFFLCEVDSNLNYIGAHCFGGSGDEKPYSLLQTSDGSIWVAGQAASSDGDVDTIFNTFSNGWVIKLTEDSILGTRFPVMKTEHSIQLYPNPASDVLNIMLPNWSGAVVFELYNAMGTLCLNRIIDAPKTSLDVSELPDGFYSYHLKDATEKKAGGKLVIRRWKK